MPIKAIESLISRIIIQSTALEEIKCFACNGRAANPSMKLYMPIVGLFAPMTVSIYFVLLLPTLTVALSIIQILGINGLYMELELWLWNFLPANSKFNTNEMFASPSRSAQHIFFRTQKM